MQVTLDLPADLEAQVTEQARLRGLEIPEYLLLLVRSPGLPQLPEPKRLKAEERQAHFDAMAQFSDKIPAMPEETFPREMIYQDHD